LIRAARLAAAAAAAALALAAGGVRGAEPETRPRRILSLHGYEPGRPADAAFTTAFRASLPLGSDLELYSEYLDRIRFPGAAYERAFREWLRTKYARTPPDVIVAVGVDALDFLADPGSNPFPGVPVVFGLVVGDSVAARRLPANFTGIVDHAPIRETLDLALALFPDTRRVVLVGGASEQDRPLNALLRREVLASGRPLEVEELFGLSMADLQARLRALRPETVVLGIAFFQDGAGRVWSGVQAVPEIVAASPAPFFTIHGNLLGSGTVGGVMIDYEATARLAARTTLSVLAGERVESIPVRRSEPNVALLDGRQLDRFGVPDGRVPAPAEVRYRQPSPWARYRSIALTGLAGLLLQSTLIALLLVERRRRWRAEAKARENLAVVAHMNRVSALGELVGSLAHEINSPLGAVLSNAEAAQRFLSTGAAGDEAEVRSCLDDIVKDVTRAGDVIRGIREVLRRKPFTPAPLDVAAVVHDALRLVKAEVRDRGVSVDVEIAPALPQVTGDEVQLVQVILNLLLNALDAVSGLPEARRRIRVSAQADGEAVAIRVQDSGPGVPAAVAAQVFDPFFTTKPVGLGMGLAITRSIVEAHGGSIGVSAAPGGGAVFDVRLPAAQAAAPAEWRVTG
jgi:signal transduction histidine kinase